MRVFFKHHATKNNYVTRNLNSEVFDYARTLGKNMFMT